MYSLIRKLLFLLDAEDAHEFAAVQMQRIQQVPAFLQFLAGICGGPRSSAAVSLWNLEFRNPIGIAAGFDKNALMMPFLAAIGFGFLEVGTVTLRPQPGNPKPRLFRVPDQKGLINRMGFNNDGADAVAARLREWKRTVPLFVNIGKNRDVPLDGAPDAYASCHRKLAPYADAVVINISSPNTPGLRDLQRPENLDAILNALDRSKPLLVKIAPDIDDALLGEICDIATKRLDGLICTNTTATPNGGLSGRPLFEKSTDILRRVRTRVGATFPLIGVGGVFTADDVRAKIAAGANLVQIYTSFIYEGPMLPSRLARA